MNLLHSEAAPGWVSVFLDAFLEEDNGVIGWYDHDDTEGASVEGESIFQATRGFHHGPHYADWVEYSAHSRNIYSAEYLWFLFNERVRGGRPYPLKNEDAEGLVKSANPVFLGTYPYGYRDSPVQDHEIDQVDAVMEKRNRSRLLTWLNPEPLWIPPGRKITQTWYRCLCPKCGKKRAMVSKYGHSVGCIGPSSCGTYMQRVFDLISEHHQLSVPETIDLIVSIE